MKFTFDVPAHGGIKVDFSVGQTVSFGNNARDEKYYLKDGASQTDVILTKRNNNNVITPSLGAFMHVYRRSPKWLALGGMFGVGVGFQSTSELNANLFAGATLVMGKQQKVMLGFGVSYLRVERIKNDEFKEGNVYQISKINLSDVTEKVYRNSVFFSLTYNLSNRTEITQ